MEIKELVRRLRSDVYAASVKIFEEAEAGGLIFGNGHHMAQKLAEEAVELLVARAVAKAATITMRSEDPTNAT